MSKKEDVKGFIGSAGELAGESLLKLVGSISGILDKETTVRIGKIVYMGATVTNIIIERRQTPEAKK